MKKLLLVLLALPLIGFGQNVNIPDVVRQLKKTFLAIGQLGIRLLAVNCQLRN